MARPSGHWALGLTALVLPAAVGWQAFRALDRQVGSLTEGVDAVAAGGPARTFVVASSGSAGGDRAYRDRTGDLLVANQVLSQLS